MKKLNISIIIILFSLKLFAGNNQVLLDSANIFYSKNDFVKAAEKYKAVVNSGFESFELYYNLGNCYFKTNNLPAAILYYEKALKLNPSDENTNFNLNIANNRIVDKIEAIPELFYARWWKKLYNLYDADSWSYMAIVSGFVFFVILSVYFISKKYILKKISFFISIFLLALSILLIVLAKTQFNSSHNQIEAIMFSPSTNAKSSPDDNSTDLFVIHEGTKVQILDNVGEWNEVRIANGSRGWVKISSLEKI